MPKTCEIRARSTSADPPETGFNVESTGRTWRQDSSQTGSFRRPHTAARYDKIAPKDCVAGTTTVTRRFRKVVAQVAGASWEEEDGWYGGSRW